MLLFLSCVPLPGAFSTFWSLVNAHWKLGSNCHSVWPGLAMTCTHFGRDQICTQVEACFSPFGHPTQVNATWVTSINLLLANEIHTVSGLKRIIFCDLRVLARKLASPFGHPTQVSTQVQFSRVTWGYLRILWPGIELWGSLLQNLQISADSVQKHTVHNFQASKIYIVRYKTMM